MLIGCRGWDYVTCFQGSEGLNIHMANHHLDLQILGEIFDTDNRPILYSSYKQSTQYLTAMIQYISGVVTSH